MQARVERFLARLMTEAELRDRFVADAVGVARQEGLTPAEAEAAAKVPMQDLLTAARSFEYKRSAKRRRSRGWSMLNWCHRRIFLTANRIADAIFRKR
jgi:hypothetical protein